MVSGLLHRAGFDSVLGKMGMEAGTPAKLSLSQVVGMFPAQIPAKTSTMAIMMFGSMFKIVFSIETAGFEMPATSS